MPLLAGAGTARDPLRARTDADNAPAEGGSIAGAALDMLDMLAARHSSSGKLPPNLEEIQIAAGPAPIPAQKCNGRLGPRFEFLPNLAVTSQGRREQLGGRPTLEQHWESGEPLAARVHEASERIGIVLD